MNRDYEILCLINEKWETFSKELVMLNGSLQDFELSDCINKLHDLRADELLPALNAAENRPETPSGQFRDAWWHYGRL